MARTPGAGRAGGGGSRLIFPDYARPSALMVPHCGTTLIDLLEEIAATAAEAIGVILLSDDPPATQRFVERQKRPDRFSIVAAAFDTPWIRDRAPIAIREDNGIAWVLPRMIEGSRPLDHQLFGAISARPATRAPLAVAQGNLVAGPQGLVLSTARVLTENNLTPDRIDAFAAPLGIRRWIVFQPFADEPTGHADVHVRFLKPDLMAVAWHPEDADLQATALAIEDAVRTFAPHVRSLRVPLVRERDRYASLVNWVQIGRILLLPTYALTPESDIAQARRLLAAEGFRVRPIGSPTLDLGGSLHCLTASIFV